MTLPNLLFRGNSFKRLNPTINREVLLTKLADGGNGREILITPFEDLICKHIGIGWDKTNFLSFSTDEQVAIKYGSRNNTHEELFFDEVWDFAVLTFDTSLLISDSINEIERGIYRAEFVPSCIEFLPTFKVILIDALTCLKKMSTINSNLTTELNNADKDSEWLILPASPFGYNGELTSKLDMKCITNKRFFRFE